MIPTSPANLHIINTMVNDVEETVTMLYNRWQDEREYETISDYLLPINKVLEKYSGFVATTMNKRPFGFDFSIGTTAKYRVFIKASSYGWERLK